MIKKFVSWNVNGLRACLKKGFLDSMKELNPDFICLQEIKMQEGQAEIELPEYNQYFCYAEKKGYSGTALLSKEEPISVVRNFGEHNDEGRSLIAEFEDFYLITVYVPNSQPELKRLEYRMSWEEDLLNLMKELDQNKPVILCGDMNVAHEEIDLKNPKTNRKNPGFSDAEREKMTVMLNSGFTDTFRYLYPDLTGAYSWWSYRFNARKNNAGWRLDYFIVSDRIKNQIEDAKIHSEIFGSDHCPVELDLKL